MILAGGGLLVAAAAAAFLIAVRHGPGSHEKASLVQPASTAPAGVETSQPAPPPRVPACRTAQLELAYLGIRGAAGTAIGLFEMRNVSPTACSVQGYVEVQLVSHHLPLPTSTSHDTAAQVAAVVLPPGTPPLRSSMDGGHGSFALTWGGRCASTPGNTPSDWRITPPGERTSVDISARTPQGTPSVVCDNTLTIEPVLAGPALP